MREVLFRGKSKHTGEWVTGAYVSKNWYLNKGVVEESNIISYEDGDECLWHLIIPESISEFTGLTDKNGKKIFEGDIVNRGGGFYVVRYGKHLIDCCGCCYEYHQSVGFYLERDGYNKKSIISDYDTWNDLYIIGNIHDNPELLKNDKE